MNFDLASFNQASIALALIVPGLIIVFFRSRFTTGRTPSFREALAPYFTLTAVYYAIVFPFIQWAYASPGNLWTHWLGWCAVTLVAPALAGVLLGVTAQRSVVHAYLRRLGFFPVHHLATAWDRKFCDMKGEWVLVTLKDGTSFAGFCGDKSFMSSDPAERDLYIEEVYEFVRDNEPWKARGHSVLITHDQIRSIEFWAQ